MKWVNKLDELIRKALLGSKEAQEECTRKKIMLPCPKCYGNISICEYSDNIDNIEITFLCEKCGLLAKMKQKFAYGKSYRVPMTPDPFTQWNDRTAPPVGRCLDCGNTCPGHDNSYLVCIMHGHAVEKR